MRRPLSGIQARVNRLASRLSTARGCHACSSEHGAIRLLVLYGDEPVPAEPSTKQKCAQCQQIIPYEYVVVRYDASMRPPEEPREVPPASDDPA